MISLHHQKNIPVVVDFESQLSYETGGPITKYPMMIPLYPNDFDHEIPHEISILVAIFLLEYSHSIPSYG